MRRVIVILLILFASFAHGGTLTLIPPTEYTDNTTTLALTGDASCKYSINGAAWATTGDNVSLNDNVALQNVASSSYSTAVSCTLNLGGVTDTWYVTTLAAVNDPAAPRFKGASMSGGWR